MADTKISALPSATTPLAGTEVLPIVQSGATVKVSIANLTEGRPVVGINGAPKTWNIPALQITNSSVYAIGSETGYYGNAYYNSGWKYTTAAAASGYLQNGGIHQWYSAASGSADGAISFTKTMDLDGSGDQKLYTGNLTFNTAAKGVNFTANTPAAGMTSQLLNWYEEGTWTPAQGSGLTVVGSFTSSGSYTRVGNMVTIAGAVSGSTSVAVSATGIITSNLPFTANAQLYFGGACNANATVSSQAFVNPSTTNLYSISAIAASGAIYFSATYLV